MNSLDKFTYMDFFISEKTIKPIMTCYKCGYEGRIDLVMITLDKVCSKCKRGILNITEYKKLERDQIIDDLLE